MRRSARHQRGFTLLEAVMVIGISLVLAGIAVVQSFGSMEAYRANSAMDIVISQMRVARQLAISQRRNVQITFNPALTPQTITYQVMPGLVAPNTGPAGPLMTVPLPRETQFIVEAGVPDTPMGFGTCGGTSGICIGGSGCCLPSMVFTPTGQFSDSTGLTIYNGTIFIGIPNEPGTARAVTIMGNTGRVRPYTYVGGTGPNVWTE